MRAEVGISFPSAPCTPTSRTADQGGPQKGFPSNQKGFPSNRIIVLVVFLLGSFVSVDALGCVGCYHSSYDYVKTIKDMKEPARSVALSLWFGAYSSETLPNPKLIDIGSGRPPLAGLKKENAKPDEKYVGLVRFKNSHIPHVTIINNGGMGLYRRASEFCVQLPSKGQKVMVRAATGDK